MALIDSKELHELFTSCFIGDKERLNEAIVIQGIYCTYAFAPEKIEENKKTIKKYVDNINDNFKKGLSFAELCIDREGNLWTGAHSSMEQLLCLGMAIGEMGYCSDDREFWKVMPFSLPYVYKK